MCICSTTLGLIDISREIVLVILHKFPSESTPCSNTGVYGDSTISKLIREKKYESTELALGRKVINYESVPIKIH